MGLGNLRESESCGGHQQHDRAADASSDTHRVGAAGGWGVGADMRREVGTRSHGRTGKSNPGFAPRSPCPESQRSQAKNMASRSPMPTAIHPTDNCLRGAVPIPPGRIPRSRSRPDPKSRGFGWRRVHSIRWIRRHRIPDRRGRGRNFRLRNWDWVWRAHGFPWRGKTVITVSPGGAELLHQREDVLANACQFGGCCGGGAAGSSPDPNPLQCRLGAVHGRGIV